MCKFHLINMLVPNLIVINYPKLTMAANALIAL
jgi:hypothetical protein